MADIELVIKIPEVFYEALRKTDMMVSGQRSGKTLMSVTYNAVAKGVPLLKGHGRLIDVDEYFKKEFGDAREFLNNATTIIEADKKKPVIAPTEKQVKYAKYLAHRMCQDLPKEYTKQAYSDFISKWKPAVIAEDAEMNEPDAWQMKYM